MKKTQLFFFFLGASLSLGGAAAYSHWGPKPTQNAELTPSQKKASLELDKKVAQAKADKEQANESLRKVTERLAAIESTQRSLKASKGELFQSALRQGPPVLHGFPAYVGKVDVQWKAISGRIQKINSKSSEFVESAIKKGPMTLRARKALLQVAFQTGRFGTPDLLTARGSRFARTTLPPATTAHLIFHILEDQGQTLSAYQVKSIQGFCQAWVKDMETKAQSYDSETLTLEKMIDEIKAKDRFVKSTQEVLNYEQRSLLFPKDSSGVPTMDLVGYGYVFYHRVALTHGEDAELQKSAEKTLWEASHSLSSYLSRKDDLKESPPAELSAIVEEWIKASPRVQNPLSKPSKELACPSLETLQDCARVQIKAMKTLIANKSVSSKRKETLKNSQLLIVLTRLQDQ